MSKPKQPKYEIWEDGEWIYPVHKGFKLACCDCGLIHTMDFDISEGMVKVKVSRDNKATAGRRRGKAYKGLKLPDGKS